MSTRKPSQIITQLDCNSIIQQAPIHTYEEAEITRFLQDLQNTYPQSQLLVIHRVNLIEIARRTNSRAHIIGAVAIIKITSTRSRSAHYRLHLLGGPRGDECFRIPTHGNHRNFRSIGWLACNGDNGQYNLCYVPPDSMLEVKAIFDRAQSQDLHIEFPPALSDGERLRREEYDFAREILLHTNRLHIDTGSTSSESH